MKHTVKVISLARSTQRRSEFSRNNAHLAFSFFDAIDGAQVHANLKQAPELFDADLRYNPGALGCASSHLLLWQEAAASDMAMTVFEDDAIVRHDFEQESARILAQLDPDWDLVVWGWNFDSILSLNLMPEVSRVVALFDQDRLRQTSAVFQRMSGTPTVLPLDKCFGTPAYTISPKGARTFLQQCLPLKNFELFFPVLDKGFANNGIDIAMNALYDKTLSFCTLPPLAVTHNDRTQSLIQPPRPTDRGQASGAAAPATARAADVLAADTRAVDADAQAGGERIPRVMHRIWFGDKPIPEQYEAYWAAWQRQLPDFEFRTWREADIVDFRSFGVLQTAEGMARKADIARYEILLRHGGIYMDCDIFPLQAFDLGLLRHGLVVCNEIEADHYCSIGFIAAEPGNAALKWAVDEVMRRPLNRLPANEDTGPWLFRQALYHSPYFKLPTRSFYPYLFNEPYSAILERDLSETLGIHVWGGSWFNEQQRLGKLIDRLTRGDLEESAKLAAASQDDPHAIGEYVDQARNARRQALDAARHPLVQSSVKIDNRAPLDFVKAGMSLLSQVPDALVWQIGAADGMQHGALRAMLVNADPPAVLLEANPYLQPLLRKNYRNNSKLVLVEAVLGAEAGTATLNAVDPARVQAAGLPDAVLGLSVPVASSDIGAALAAGDAVGQLIGTCFDQVGCRMVDIDHLLELHPGVMPAIVAIDTLGVAAELIALLMQRGLKPFMLSFARHGLSEASLEQVAALLADDYVTVGEGDEVLAYRSDFLATYCEHLYVENGVHTLYRSALRFVMNLG